MFLVQSVNRDGEEAIGHFYFYDATLALIENLEKPDYQFDPRTRPWYIQASQASLDGKTPNGIIQTDPYIFSSNQKIGITLAVSGANKTGIVGIDMSLTGLSRLVGRQKITPSTELVLFDSSGAVLAYHDTNKIFQTNKNTGKREVVLVPELGVAALSKLFEHWKTKPHSGAKLKNSSKMEVNGEEWYYWVESIDNSGEQSLFLGVAVPNAELMEDSIYIQNLSIVLSLILMMLMLPAVFYASKKTSSSLRNLVKVAKSIESFDFSGEDPVRSSITEVDDLALNMTSMKHTLKRFLDISSALSAESNFHRLINIILRETISVSGATSGALVLVSTDRKTVQAAARQLHGLEQDVSGAPIYALDENPDRPLDVKAIEKGCSQFLRINRSDPLHSATYADLFNALGVEQAHIVALPLRNRSNEVLGALNLTFKVKINEKNDSASPISPALLAFIEAISGISAIAIDNQKMISDQKILLESLIQLVAGAIDAKSAYSGAHCQRVPELSKMLAKAACDKKDGPFADFSMTEEGWEALHIAGWLHDCGKVTTPEFVVDKATKLETIYDRIHEIRMRFEVLKRDAEITVYQQALVRLVAPEILNMDKIQSEMAEPLATLDREFEFIATCNVGGEFMAPKKIEQLKAIAQKRWLRTINDRLGISYPELLQRQTYPLEPLPVWENLLSDKPEHISPRIGNDIINVNNNPWGFKISAPENLYNRGEIYNLAIVRGTLTEEERYKINEHIIQTIKMLSALPFPKHLSRVTEIAGGHHEKMDGTGYPRRLLKNEMSIEARMMAIADVFEALTAVDRPYKNGKTLSESVKIMGFMRKDHHIDPDLFELFLESGVYLEYAHRFMRPEQIDAVNIASYLTSSQVTQ